METRESITYDDVETFIFRCMMRIENKLETELENKTSYIKHDIALMDLIAAFFLETTNKLKNKRNQMGLLLS